MWESTIALVDTITRVDAALYASGLRIMLAELASLAMLCPARLQALRSRLAYVPAAVAVIDHYLHSGSAPEGNAVVRSAPHATAMAGSRDLDREQAVDAVLRTARAKASHLSRRSSCTS